MTDTAGSAEQRCRIIITAGKGGGKTTAIRRVIDCLHRASVPYTGFFAEGAWDGDVRSSFTLHCVPEDISVPLCDRTTGEWVQHGRFRYNPEALQKGDQAVRRAVPGTCIIMDEISRQELRGNVWADTLTRAVRLRENPLVLAVQRRCLEDVISAWGLEGAVVFDLEMISADRLPDYITGLIENGCL